jgi:hypothetical protein
MEEKKSLAKVKLTTFGFVCTFQKLAFCRFVKKSPNGLDKSPKR